MKTPTPPLFPALAALLLLAAAPEPARAWSLFHGEESRLLERADAAFASADAAAAEGRLQDEINDLSAAVQEYQRLSAKSPDYRKEHVADRLRDARARRAALMDRINSGELAWPGAGAEADDAPVAMPAGERAEAASATDVFRPAPPRLVRLGSDEPESGGSVTNEPATAAEPPAPPDDPILSETIRNPFYKANARKAEKTEPAPAEPEPAPEPAPETPPDEPEAAPIEPEAAPEPAKVETAPAAPEAAPAAPEPAPAAPEPAPAKAEPAPEPDRPAVSVAVRLHEPPAPADTAKKASRFLAKIRTAQAFDAVDELEDLLEEEGEDAPIELRLLFARALLECRNLVRADTVLQALPPEAESNPSARLLRAAVALGRDDSLGAMLQLDVLLREHPEFADAYIDLAFITLLRDPKGGREHAISYYRAGLERGARRDPRLESELGIRIED